MIAIVVVTFLLVSEDCGSVVEFIPQSYQIVVLHLELCSRHVQLVSWH
jgi:hypothetical protein